MPRVFRLAPVALLLLLFAPLVGAETPAVETQFEVIAADKDLLCDPNDCWRLYLDCLGRGPFPDTSGADACRLAYDDCLDKCRPDEPEHLAEGGGDNWLTLGNVEWVGRYRGKIPKVSVRCGSIDAFAFDANRGRALVGAGSSFFRADATTDDFATVLDTACPADEPAAPAFDFQLPPGEAGFFGDGWDWATDQVLDWATDEEKLAEVIAKGLGKVADSLGPYFCEPDDQERSAELLAGYLAGVIRTNFVDGAPAE